MPDDRPAVAMSNSLSLRLVDVDAGRDSHDEVAATRTGQDVAILIPEEGATPAPAEMERRLVAAITQRDEERRRAERAELEVLDLRARVSELETWTAERVGFEEREQLQLDRLLTARAAERAERAGRFLSVRLLLLAVYVVAAAGFAWLLLAEQV